MNPTTFNAYLSNEKFLIKTFNQRCMDPTTGLYQSNDFSQVCEYFLDKHILKTLSKCKEHKLKTKMEYQEQQAN